MDDSPLEEYINLIQSKTATLDSYSRELMNYVALLTALNVKIDKEELTTLDKLLFNAVESISQLDAIMVSLVEELEKLFNQADRPS